MSAPGRAAPPGPERLTPPPAQHRLPTHILAPPGTFELAVAAFQRRRRLVVALPLAFAAIAVAVVIPRPRYYVARAAFVASEPQSMSGSLGALSSVASQLGVPGLSAIASSSSTASPQFYGDLLTSSAILHAVVTTTYDATGVGKFDGKPFRGDLVKYLDAKAKTPVDEQLAAMKQLAKSLLVVTVDRPTGIVRLEVRTKNRRLSALVARRLLDLINDFNLVRRQTQAGAEREFDARRTQAAVDTLRAAEGSLAAFRAANIDFSRSPQLGTHEAELERRVSMAQQIYTTIAQRYELANIEAVRNTPVVTVLDAPENLVEAQPRHTAAILLGAFFLGLLIACAIALRAERVSDAR
jgi:uncharacterized protein involved in exopolysaccharide biosynthesis